MPYQNDDGYIEHSRRVFAVLSAPILVLACGKLFLYMAFKPVCNRSAVCCAGRTPALRQGDLLAYATVNHTCCCLPLLSASVQTAGATKIKINGRIAASMPTSGSAQGAGVGGGCKTECVMCSVKLQVGRPTILNFDSAEVLQWKHGDRVAACCVGKERNVQAAPRVRSKR